MKIEFDQINAGFEEISIKYYPRDVQEHLEREPEAENWSHICLSLPLYLSGKIDTDEEIVEESRAW